MGRAEEDIRGFVQVVAAAAAAVVLVAVHVAVGAPEADGEDPALDPGFLHKTHSLNDSCCDT